MSTLNFNSKTSQVCFVSLPKDKALEIITSKAIPVNTIAYEYSDEVPKKNGDVIVAVEIDTTNMLDLTHKPDYIKYMQSKLDKNIKLDKSISIIRYSCYFYISKLLCFWHQIRLDIAPVVPQAKAFANAGGGVGTEPPECGGRLAGTIWAIAPEGGRQVDWKCYQSTLYLSISFPSLPNLSAFYQIHPFHTSCICIP